MLVAFAARTALRRRARKLLQYINIPAFVPAWKGLCPLAVAGDGFPGRQSPIRASAFCCLAACNRRACKCHPGAPSPARSPEKKHLFIPKVLGATNFLPYIALADGFGPSINQRIRNRTLMAKKAKKAVKKAAPKKAAAAKPAAPKPIKEALSKSGLVAHIANATSVAAKDVRAVIAALEAAVHGSVSKKGAGSFTLPGLLKITAVSVPAKPKRKGINPFTKEEQWFAAKPASVKVKVRPLKKLKDAAA
jgi:nucleoid DNA-binding protein